MENELINDNIVERDLFDTKLMGIITPRPSTVIDEFNKLYAEDSKKATDYFYKLSCDSDYIRKYRIKKDIKWTVPSEYGEMDITINLSKPEKDPKAIAAAKMQSRVAILSVCCVWRNIGYRGRLNHPARQNIRVIPCNN